MSGHVRPYAGPAGFVKHQVYPRSRGLPWQTAKGLPERGVGLVDKISEGGNFRDPRLRAHDPWQPLSGSKSLGLLQIIAVAHEAR